MSYLWVAIGGALGSMARFWVDGVISQRFPTSSGGSVIFPWGTILINITGSFLIGLLAALTAPGGRLAGPVVIRQLCMVGICGGYTTFSAFSLQNLMLIRDGEWLHAGGNAVISVLCCVVAVWLGYLLGSACNSVKGS